MTNVQTMETAQNGNVQESGKLQPIYTLKNGVKKFPLLVENDYNEAQKMLDMSDGTSDYDAYCIFNERVVNNFCGTYEIKVTAIDEFEKFENMLSEIKNTIYSVMEAYKNNILEPTRIKYHRGEIDWDVWNAEYRRVNRIPLSEMLTETEIKINDFRYPSFDEWKSGKYEDSENRTVKLGKAMRKAGFEQSVIDFYSQQIRDEKKVYLTISDRVQHITGMSNYVDLDSDLYKWDGYQNSSCQDTRHGYDEVYKLGASLHDNKLFIAMLHLNLDDVNDMTDKLIARTMLRHITIDRLPLLVGTCSYGNNITKKWLRDGLSMLNEVDIYKAFNEGRITRHEENTNGYLGITKYDDVEINETIEEDVSCDCPMCEGSGQYEVFSHRFDEYYKVNCPMCDGDGTYSAYVYEEINTTVEVEREVTIQPYNEHYSHYGSYIYIDVCLDMIKANREMHGNVIIEEDKTLQEDSTMDSSTTDATDNDIIDTNDILF